MFGRKDVVVPVEISARHVHLSQGDLEALFGLGYTLKNIRQLSQPGEFACQETVDIEVNSRYLKNVRIVGPIRERTQVEISRTDAISLKVDPPTRLSGDLDKSHPVNIYGLVGKITLPEGLIIAKRHIHCATNEAAKLHLKNGGNVDVSIKGGRSVIFKNVSVRVKDDYKLCMHLDTDEGNACAIDKSGQGEIIKK